MRFFTICSNNYLANAITLGKQLASFHPDSEFTIFLADKQVGYDPSIVPFNVIPMEDIGLIDERGMITRYNISELNTAIKPFCFSYLFRESDEPVVYMDPDTYPVSPLVEVEEALQDHNAVVTPHILRPVERGGFLTENFSRLGIYNLGFVAFRSCPDVEAFLVWWSEKLEKDCVIDIPRGIFVDQKWADFIPSFIADTKVLRHPGYNVAYWNLHNRKISEVDGEYRSNKQPLRFVHFSGLPDADQDEISKRYTAFTKSNTPVLGQILDEYRKMVAESDEAVFADLEFAYFISPLGETNLHAPELGQSQDRVNRAPGTYLVTKTIDSLEAYEKFQTNNASAMEARRAFEYGLIKDQGEYVTHPGYDFMNGTRATFHSSYLYAYETTPGGDLVPNWREHVAGPGIYCNRIRGFVHLFFQEFQPKFDSKIWMTEQATDLYRWMKTRFPETVGSEFLGDPHLPGEQVGELRNENVEEPSWESDSFDYILSLDVFEHVAYYEKALAEMYRCLAPGGYFVFAIPTNGFDQYEHEIRAVMHDDGTIEHFTEPEYHGNPVDEDGALCFRYYGWKLLDEMKAVGFQNPFALEYWSDSFGYLGQDQLLFVAQKP